ncbi:MBL fold metallo-hydrolase [Candidatus Gracilibacteria bacterium]|nr:MBL fold metallo-hydrolase [Candidatus Gracilibacteria bacterium]
MITPEAIVSQETVEKGDKINRTFSGAIVEYIGGIESVEQQTSITGSCTLVEIKDTQGKTIKIVIDAGMHQGGKHDSTLNQNLDPRILEADYIIVTHAHIDHIGRLPQIVSQGFKGKIIMSPTTWDLSYLSLLDSAKVMKRERDEAIEYNKRLGKKLQQLVKYLNDKNKKRGIRRGRGGSKIDTNTGVLGNQEYLDAFSQEYPDVKSQTDIRPYLKEIPEPLFNEDNVHALNRYITTLDTEPGVTQELILQQGPKSDDKQRPRIHSIHLEFLDAGHIIGSAQALIRVEVTRIITNPSERLEKGLRGEQESHKLLFTGDLGRNEGYSGKALIPDEEIRYAQVESTYAGRPEHTSRIEAKDNLFETLQDCEGDAVIPAFALQRSQEVLLMLLDYYEAVIQPQIQELKEEAKGKTREEKRLIGQRINELDREIILDSPLAISMTEVFIQKAGKDFYPLSEEAQKKRFGKVVIGIQSEKLYKGEAQEDQTGHTKNIKRIIVAPSGMCEGGSVIAHLKEHLGRHTSNIVFIGYTPPQSLGGKIKTEKEVVIEGEVYPIYATVHNLDGFSGHISHNGIVEYIDTLKSKTRGVIALTHGGDNRLRITPDIEKKKQVKIITPDLGERVTLKF